MRYDQKQVLAMYAWLLSVFLLQALYHTLPMNYVTVSKLQSKLDGEVNQATVRKLIDKMTCGGFVEAKSNRRLGVCSHIIKISFQFMAQFWLSQIAVIIFLLFIVTGKRVIHSDLTEKKLMEVKKTLDIDSMVKIKIFLVFTFKYIFFRHLS